MDNELVQQAIHLGSQYAFKIIASIVVFVVGRFIAKQLTRLFVKALERRKVEITLTSFLDNIVYYTLITAVVIAALNQLGVSTTSFVTVVGAAGLAVGLALKDSLSNFSAGVMIILFRPFKIGDFVSVAGESGTVREITIFNTIITTPDNQKVIIPNNSIMGNVITNVTANPTRRIDLVAGIGYGDDIDAAKKAIEEILAAEKRILDDPSPTIAVSELADSSVNFVVRPWVRTEDYWDVRFALTEQIKKVFDKQGINIPFPQQDVHLFVEQGGQ